MKIKEKIEDLMDGATDKLFYNFYGRGIYKNNASVEKPRGISHGDYSTNIAIALSKKLNKNPVEIANKIVSQIQKNNLFEKIEVTGMGFINFYLKREIFADNLKEILKKKSRFGENQILKNKKVVIEYTDPNPFKEFHIGHLMSNSVGEALSRILEFQGAKIKRANYQGDVGLHVAKAIWGMMKMKENSTFGSNKVKDLSFAYAHGAKEYESNSAVKKEINQLNGKIYDGSDKEINKLYNDGKKWSLEHFEKIYKILGTKFDYYFFESETAIQGKKIVDKNLGKVFERGENKAVIFVGEKHGLHTRVFVNSGGLPTYEAKELALAEIKRKKLNYDKSIIITANEIKEYFKVVLSAMKLIFPELAARTEHIGHGMMKLPEGKMSSRTGKVVSFDFLFGEARKMVLEKMKGENLSEKEKQNIAEKAAVGALKYPILKQSIGNDIIYNPEKSVSFEGDSGPYLQYSYARAQSVLRKAKAEGVSIRIYKFTNDTNYRSTNLEKVVIYFPEVVEKAGKEYAPHLITTYLTELAREFNNYYAKEKIVDRNDKFSPHKVALTEAFSIVMKNGLWLLGIQALEEM